MTTVKAVAASKSQRQTTVDASTLGAGWESILEREHQSYAVGASTSTRRGASGRYRDKRLVGRMIRGVAGDILVGVAE